MLEWRNYILGVGFLKLTYHAFKHTGKKVEASIGLLIKLFLTDRE